MISLGHSGKLKDLFFEITQGNVEGASAVLKFGRNADIDTGGFEDVWEYGGSYTFSSSAVPYHISSSDNGDTQIIELQLLTEDSNGNWNQEIFNITLAGQTETTIVTPSGDNPIRIFRMKNVDSTDIAGIVYVYEDDTVVGGVPNTVNKIRATMSSTNQTLMAIYTIPSGKTGYVVSLFADMNRSVTSGASDSRFCVRPFGGVFQVKLHAAMVGQGGSHFQHDYKLPLPIEAKSDVMMQADASANNTDVSAGFDLILLED